MTLTLLALLVASVTVGAYPRVDEAAGTLPGVATPPQRTLAVLAYSSPPPYETWNGATSRTHTIRPSPADGTPVVLSGGWKTRPTGGVFFFANLTVCADASCTYNNSQLQTAINDAACGDEVLIQKNTTYVGEFIWRVKCDGTDTVLRTGVNANGSLMSASQFPAADVRIAPTPALATAHGGDGDCGGEDCEDVLAKLQSNSNNRPALRTVQPAETGNGCSAEPCRANYQRAKWIEFIPRTPWAQGTLVLLGSNDDIFDTQTDSGTNLTVHASVNTDVLPDNHTAASTDVDDWVNITGGAGFTTGRYRILSIQGSYWRLDRSPAATGTSGGTWFSADIQNMRAEIPHHLTLEQVILRGDPVLGQHRGLTVAADHVVLKDSYCYDIWTVGVETQCVNVVNDEGPVEIVNSYLESSGENFMVYGSDPFLTGTAQITGSPTATQFTLTSVIGELPIATMWISVVRSGTEHSCKITAIAGNDVTVESGCLGGAPDVPGNVDWAWQFGGLTFKKNKLSRPLAWRDAIVAIPTGLSATGFTTGGSCAAGTYDVRTRARHVVHGNTMVQGDLTSIQQATVSSGSTGRIEVSWNAVTNVTATYSGEYYVYATLSGTTTRYTVTAPTTALTITCTGGTTTSATPGFDVRTVKNVFELKGCDGDSEAGPCLIEGNIFERSWLQAQDGPCVLIKNTNQDNTNDSVVTRNVTFRNNIIRSCVRALEICAGGGGCENKPSGRIDDLVITNNLIYDIGPDWGLSKSAVYMTAGAWTGFLLNHHGDDWVFEHNTVLQDDDAAGAIGFDIDPNETGTDHKLTDFIFRNNIFRRSTAGGQSGLRTFDGSAGMQAEGTTSWNLAKDANGIYGQNVFSDATCGNYPSGTLCPTETQLQAYFVDYANGNYRCANGAACDNAGTDGLDIGANIDQIEAFTDIAQSGDNRSGGALGRPTRLKLRLRREAP